MRRQKSDRVFLVLREYMIILRESIALQVCFNAL